MLGSLQLTNCEFIIFGKTAGFNIHLVSIVHITFCLQSSNDHVTYFSSQSGFADDPFGGNASPFERSETQDVAQKTTPPPKTNKQKSFFLFVSRVIKAKHIHNFKVIKNDESNFTISLYCMRNCIHLL